MANPGGGLVLMALQLRLHDRVTCGGSDTLCRAGRAVGMAGRVRLREGNVKGGPPPVAPLTP